MNSDVGYFIELYLNEIEKPLIFYLNIDENVKIEYELFSFVQYPYVVDKVCSYNVNLYTKQDISSIVSISLASYEIGTGDVRDRLDCPYLPFKNIKICDNFTSLEIVNWNCKHYHNIDFITHTKPDVEFIEKSSTIIYYTLLKKKVIKEFIRPIIIEYLNILVSEWKYKINFKYLIGSEIHLTVEKKEYNINLDDQVKFLKRKNIIDILS